jgi:hypothetical protein
LLELFPIANLRSAWPDEKGTKEEVGFAVAEQRNYEQIIRFVDENFSCCKQHVYIYSANVALTQLPAVLQDGERVFAVEGSYSLYVVRSRYKVVLRDPLEDTNLDFLWPIRIETTANKHVVVRFVVLEKNLSSYFERPYLIAGRSVDENAILRDIKSAFQIQPTDIHKGVKALWDDGFMDSSRAKYKKPISMASEAMDEAKGIKEHNPELYEILLESVLLDTLFTIPPDKNCSVTAVLIDPSNGYVAFPRYSEKKGDTDFVIGEILTRNQ